MFQLPLATSSTIIPQTKFWEAVILYHNRPHLINRKILAVSQALFYEIHFNSENSVTLQDLINRASILYELRKLDEISPENLREGFLRRLLESYDKNVKLEEVKLEDIKFSCTGIFVSARVLFPRLKQCPKAIELIIIDKEHNKIRFLVVSDSIKKIHYVGPPFPYEIELTNTQNLRINVDSIENADTSHAEWLVDKLFEKLIKWTQQTDDDSKQIIQSLSLVKTDEYCLTYNRIKETYGEKLVNVWPTKSGTDPQKFVFEDIAIASYLICLWKNDTEIKFVDCGCGNGLLVYLLNQEGYKGYGLDVRRRAIWDIFPETTTKLKIETVGPDSIFPDCTWIIGNHSDELTPWIPVMALKSSPKTNYFVLPCCTYDFNGHKFIRRNNSISAYADYMSYIEDISNKCGFDTAIDKLRIPSTKRTCLVGRQKSIDDEKRQRILTDIGKLVEAKTENSFVQRSDIEKVRNCTQLDKNLISNIVKMCINELLTIENYIEKSDGELWNQGGQLTILDLVKVISKDQLKQLKQECGGLQTLLRNHRYLFDLSAGFVKIRLPVSAENTLKYKNKPCWFIKNHPHGCLYDGNNCGYTHE
ncbi:unnamed protein product [Ceutorhynchus assimilis]|uniref:tRNA (uracil-O(2)-)-methyltransferase n=1 Tax=Ceutorhynchus assimilis TaxID=467358 RepID=A0A9N9MI43_9CUCU|nr:unnamed protein product [Ceutorhynchus assimilis]